VWVGVECTEIAEVGEHELVSKQMNVVVNKSLEALGMKKE
jgi:hypothetical protein